MGDGRCFWLLIVSLAAMLAAAPADLPDALGPVERQELDGVVRSLADRLQALRRDPRAHSEGWRDRIADAEVFAKGVTWALKYDDTFTAADRTLLKAATARCASRLTALESGDPRWTAKAGKVVRGFVSAVDGSVQPYGMVIPAGYRPEKAMRLDVVLHGSSKPAGMSELRFMDRFDEGDGPTDRGPDVGYLELHPLGRVENGYRWAGETDVFEAIEAACRNYRVDRTRIVLRGMSMGASGTWHLGLKHPDRFVALGPYCGYVDTHEFSRTPLPNFVPVGTLPDDQEKMLHMLDSVDYAANAGMVPTVACMGDKDIFFQAHEIMSRAMAREGLAMVNLISHGTGHVVDPATHAEQMRRIGAIAAVGVDPATEHIRFVTWTLKYSRCHWLQVLGLEEHYARAEIEGWRKAAGTVELREPRNVTCFAVFSPIASRLKTVKVGNDSIGVPEWREATDRAGVVVGKRAGHWAYLGELGRVELAGKRPGLQGPIDDAFTAPFLCVRGTGRAWSPAVQAWSDASLKRFAYEWSRYFRGELPIKDDTAVTDEDIGRFHLILFGDPGSNAWIARLLPRLPIQWTREDVMIDKLKFPASSHAPLFIQPSPIRPGRYVVVNSGHSFHERELSTLNYLLFPRLGDWAIVKVGDPERSSGEVTVQRGFFEADQWPASVKDPAQSR